MPAAVCAHVHVCAAEVPSVLLAFSGTSAPSQLTPRLFRSVPGCSPSLQLVFPVPINLSPSHPSPLMGCVHPRTLRTVCTPPPPPSFLVPPAVKELTVGTPRAHEYDSQGPHVHRTWSHYLRSLLVSKPLLTVVTTLTSNWSKPGAHISLKSTSKSQCFWVRGCI